ncbi:unnamed protein product [Sphagnum balticum]
MTIPTEIKNPDKWTALKERLRLALLEHEEAEELFARRPKQLIKAPEYGCAEVVIDALIVYAGKAELIRLDCEKQFWQVSDAIQKGEYARAHRTLSEASTFYQREKDLANHVRLKNVLLISDNSVWHQMQ